MTLFISIIFILSCNLFIFNLPSFHGQPQGYHVSTISQVLTPQERLWCELFNILPDRIYYSRENGCYMVRGQTGYYKNDLRRKKGKQYKYIPRWQYYMNELSPVSLIKSGIDIASDVKNMLFGGDLDDDDDDVDVDKGNYTAGSTDNNAAGSTDNNATGSTDNNADGVANHDKNIEKEPGLLSKGMAMGNYLMTPLYYVFGNSEDANNKNNGEKKDDINDKKNENKDENKDDNKDENKDENKDDNKDENKSNTESDKTEDSTSNTGMVGKMLESNAVKMAKDVMQNDLAKEAVETGISMFVPGGPAIVAAIEAASKYQKANDAVDKVEDKLHI